MEAMTEATRLTRQGRLAEATALIQQTLASAPVTRRAPDPPRAEEPSGGAPARSPAFPLSPPAGGATQRRGLLSGRPRGLRLFPSRGASGTVLTHRPGAPAADRPAGRLDVFSYSNPAGTRSYRLYVPAGHPGGPLPLVVMLHGGTQDAATFAAATGMNALAEQHRFLVAYPEQPR